MSSSYLVRGSCASISWIDCRSFLFKWDPDGRARYVEKTTVSRQQLLGRDGYRFVNFLEGDAEVDAATNRVVGARFTPASAMYESLSFNDLPPETFEMCRRIQLRGDAVTFTQLVGCRTHSPESVAGDEAGSLMGFLAAAGAQIVRQSDDTQDVRDLGNYYGQRLGQGLVEGGVLWFLRIAALPPIWTELSLTIHRDGRTEATLSRHSLFPSLCFYLSDPKDRSGQRYQRQRCYDAVPLLNEWRLHGWGPLQGSHGNPWKIPDPRALDHHRDSSAQCPP